MDRHQLTASLDACLVTEEEMQLDAGEFVDRFPNMPAEELVSVG